MKRAINKSIYLFNKNTNLIKTHIIYYLLFLFVVITPFSTIITIPIHWIN